MNLWNYGQNRSRFSLLSTWLEALYEDFAWNWASEILHPHNQKLGIQFWIQNLIPMTLSHTRNVSTQDLIVASQCPFGISPFLDYFHQGRHSLIECFFMTARVLDLGLFKSFSDFKSGNAYMLCIWTWIYESVTAVLIDEGKYLSAF